MSLTSYSRFKDLLMKARGGSGAHLVTSRCPGGFSPSPSVAG